MSDFVFSNSEIPKNKLELCFGQVYSKKKKIKYFFSRGRTLCFTENIYNGFKSYINGDEICIVLGGPILRFRDNNFISSKRDDNNEGTKSIYERWIVKKEINWDVDVDGPFVVMLFNMKSGQFNIVTDMLSIIPVYQKKEKEVIISSHINIINLVSSDLLDQVSIADYIINNVVTFPHTIFKNIKQIYPASIHTWLFKQKEYFYGYDNYWLPIEPKKGEEQNVVELANRLRNGVKSFIDQIVDANPKLGLLMSGGEDSRSVAGMVSKNYKKEGFIYCVSRNNEIVIAEKIADCYNINLNIGFIEEDNFINTYKEVTNLVGVGCDSTNVHSYSFSKFFDFQKYDAILGGFLADTFLKSLWSEKKRSNNFFFKKKESVDENKEYIRCNHSDINDELIEKVNKRRNIHWNLISAFRPRSVQEWMGIWPMSMQRDIPNIYGHRRLFNNYEPYTSNEVIKVGAIAPQKIKLNRILFREAMKPFFKEVKWIPHNAGFLPFFSYKINSILFIPFYKFYFKITSRNKITMTDWDNIFQKEEVKKKGESYFSKIKEECDDLFRNEKNMKLMEGNNFNNFQKRNLFQLGYFLSNRKE
ncbi:hypothetical protein DS884_17545 [Tenacibaculum sp. E3R01]|uniref:asparagine synthase-related protein n=1 Tax=Tenacibaculum sp. E3R01 TaxID=2267227 RepID=UPI000DEBD47A|nr:asparagine synthase-related protein [Tenacibaculum sp. E3R01]RBW54258.1 hypothetical protein DS884_17545 [Tenacibaculum sp. E3R01]